MGRLGPAAEGVIAVRHPLPQRVAEVVPTVTRKPGSFAF